ncbi:MAG TPA: glycosyltransferase family 39 protein [Solirubrobacteraceae bacterium]|jgi:4-amino-4-deoxy-L-arabinose transferase-like glycosyltransferase|nr:glycosyltransferase family 39 protein [Solirubrobacteraceae bacterium]
MTRGAGFRMASIVLVGAVLRFATLDVQSLWFDEAVTARLLRMDLGGLLHAIPDSESTPPLYYLLAWVWTHACGTGEAGMRSLSALLGTLTIPIAWALGRRLGGDRAALAAAALLACNPLLVWFSQEARSYALLVLLAALSALLWLRALDAPGDVRRLLAWGAVAALALATHYYALFLVAPQALWLLVRAPDARARIAALALPAGAAAALAPLALAQRANDTARFIADTPLATRLAQIPKQFLVGYDAPAETALTILSAVVMLVAIGGLVAILAGRIGAPASARSDARRLAALVVAALALPILASIGGEDHLLTRNLVAVLPLAAALAGAGFVAVAHAHPRAVAASVAAACLLGLVAVVGVGRDPQLQRDDWRGVARALGPAVAGRLIVAPGPALLPLGYYVPRLRTVPAATAPPTAELDYVDLSERTPGQLATPRRGELPPPVAGFAVAARTEGETFTVVRLRAPVLQAVVPAALAHGLDGRPALVFTTP